MGRPTTMSICSAVEMIVYYLFRFDRPSGIIRRLTNELDRMRKVRGTGKNRKK